MSTLNAFILEKAFSGKIDLETGTELLQLAKKELGSKQSLEIAIIGMALKMPGADSVEKFWENLRCGVDCIIDLPETRRRDSERLMAFLNWNTGNGEFAPGGYLQAIDQFDCHFFKLAPKEAALMDPSQRLFLETAWHAMEDAGYSSQHLSGSRTGIYVGFNGWPVYGEAALHSNPEAAAQSTLGNLASVIPSRISYLLDLHGPAVTVDTACSSSLSAVHLACRGIYDGDCELAIAGGVNLRLIPLKNMGALGIEAATNRTRSFDHLSDGTVWGEGSAAILLKPFSKALADHDRIYAVIKGSSLNQDGSSIGLTAPNVLAQEDMLVKAWQDSRINPETITFIEAHGTGTPLGDPIEIDAMTRGFRRFTAKKQFCAIGSLKSNCGHLDGASGIAGLMKAVLALKHREIPPSLHFCQPNRKIDFPESPVYVNDRLAEWPEGDSPRRAGVNSFGLSGTNCHVILEEFPMASSGPLPFRDRHLLAISAKSFNALQGLIREYQIMLLNDAAMDPNAICFTANTGRGHYDHRLAVIFNDIADLCYKLKQLDLTLPDGLNIPGVYYGRHKIVPETKNAAKSNELTAAEWRDMNRRAQNILADLNLEAPYLDSLEEIARYYIQGANIDWSRLYPSGKRVRLPLYPFEKNRCWLELPDQPVHVSEDAGQSGWYYQTVWRVSDPTPNRAGQHYDPIWFIDLSGSGWELPEKMARYVENSGSRVVRLKIGKQFQQRGDHEYEVSGSAVDYQLLLETSSAKLPAQIVLLATAVDHAPVNDLSSLNQSLENGVVVLDHLVQAFVNFKFKQDVDLVLIAANVHQVTGLETTLHPEQATLFGLGKVIRMEHLNLHCRCLDIDRHVGVDELLTELHTPAKEYLVAFRDGVRYSEELTKIDLAAVPERELSFHETGVYVVTGGTGGIGLEVSKFLAGKGRVNLALLQRSPLPERSQWETILERAEEPRLCRSLRTILELEQTGAKIGVYMVNIADEQQMTELFDGLRRQFGRINGIVQSAGVPGDGMDLMETMLPKVQGTWILHQLTRNDNPDFFLLFSSGMTVTGGLGVGAYTAANSYLDSFAAYRHQLKADEITATINWPTWRDSVMKGANERLAEERQLFMFISNREAAAVLDHVLHHDLHRVIIGRLNYKSTILHFQNYLPFELAADLKTQFREQSAPNQVGKIKNERLQEPIESVQLTGRENGNYSELEQHIGRIWGGILGFHELNIDDSFYEIGGDSIKAVQVIAKLPQFKVEITDTLRHPTIAGLSEHLTTQHPTGNFRFKAEAKNERKWNQTEFEYLPEFPGSKILDLIHPFNEVIYKDCFYNAFFPVIRHFQQKLDSFLADDLAVYLYHDTDDAICFDFQYLSRQGIPRLLDQLGIVLAMKPDTSQLVMDLVRALAENHPVIIRVDCYYEPNRYDTFRQDHWEHCLLIYGYDQTAQVFHCLEHDNLNSLAYKPLLIGYYHLLQAYQGYLNHFHQDADQPSFYEFRPAEVSALSEPDSVAELRQHVSAHKESLLKQFELVEMFHKDWQQWLSNPEKLAANIDQVVYLINKIIKGKYSQQYQLRILLPGQPDLLDISNCIIAAWGYLKATVEKYKYSGRFREHEFRSSADKLLQIAQWEKDYYQLLISILEL